MRKVKTNERGLVKRKTTEVEVLEPVEDELYKNVRSIIVKARAKVYTAANTALVRAYWDVGREIVEKQGGEARSRYGDGLVARLSLKLTAEFGQGYNKVNLFYMRRFFLAFPKVHTLCKQLNWSHYRTLITVENSKARQFYFDECAKSGWSVRDLQRQISTHFYERLVRNHVDLRKASALVKRTEVQPKDIVRSPAILEFAGVAPGEYLESDLERGLIKHLSKFMMELGRGFCLECEQRPIQIGGKTYHCDLVFYNYIARCFVLIDLKVGEITPEDIGQMQLYKHYFERELMRKGDNPPIGIVLGSERNEAVIRYTLNENERNLFAVKYHLDLPTDEELCLELQRERAAIEESLLLKEKRSSRGSSKGVRNK